MPPRKERHTQRDVPGTGAASRAARNKAKAQPRLNGKFTSTRSAAPALPEQIAELQAELSQERELRIEAQLALETKCAEVARLEAELEGAIRRLDASKAMVQKVVQPRLEAAVADQAPPPD